MVVKKTRSIWTGRMREKCRSRVVASLNSTWKRYYGRLSRELLQCNQQMIIRNFVTGTSVSLRRRALSSSSCHSPDT